MTLYNLSFSSPFLVPPGHYWVCSEHYERVCVRSYAMRGDCQLCDCDWRDVTRGVVTRVGRHDPR